MENLCTIFVSLKLLQKKNINNFKLGICPQKSGELLIQFS